MISRVAENCFWLLRYLERADGTARLLGVNVAYELDTYVEGPGIWRPVLVVSGQAPRFEELMGATASEDGELVQQHLTWDEDNPASIRTSLFWARENARTVRETISREVWESVNDLWLWLCGSAGKRRYERERSEFYAEIKRAIQTLRGTMSDTMLNEEPLEFMRLGMNLERAGMTARVLDVTYHLIEAGGSLDLPSIEFASRHAILRSCGGIEAFFKRGRSLTRGEIAAFLLKDPGFPRSVLHCLRRADHALARILKEDDPAFPRRHRAPAFVGELHDLVSSFDPTSWTIKERHVALTRVVDSLARACDTVAEDFFGSEMHQMQTQGGES